MANSFQLPCCEQTVEGLKQWLAKRAAAGSIVVVRHERWNLYEYHLDEIVRINPRRRRVHLRQHGAFDFAGTGMSAPKGYLTLLEPTPAVLRAAAEGRTWQHGRPAFKRPLCAHEIALARTALARDPAASQAPGGADKVAEEVIESTRRSRPIRRRDR